VAYEIQFVASAKRQLKSFPVPERTGIVAAIEEQLTHEPSIETRKRKRLRPNPIAPFELRTGKIRIFYDVQESISGHDPCYRNKRGQQVVH
jgi:mRNA-degrading endonuclease RelE of RelBE toxin-antitoxin system